MSDGRPAVTLAVASLLCSVALLAATPSGSTAEHARRVARVRAIPGLVAFWDFVKRDAVTGRFNAYQALGDRHDFRLDATNYVRDYWREGRPATYDDFPLLGRGPFGQAVRISAESDPTFRPVLLVPRVRLHDSGLDVKGPGRSVTLVAWLLYESGNHAIAGIWHEGTDLRDAGHAPAVRVEPGQRQYALFAGLAANPGAAAAHVSENGGPSFGDRYARNLSVTRQRMRPVLAIAGPEVHNQPWNTIALTFDHQRHEVTSWIDGRASPYWIDDPAADPFFKWPAVGWQQAQWRTIPGMQPGEDATFPVDQLYQPPETVAVRRDVITEDASARVEVVTFAFTRVRVSSRRSAAGEPWQVVTRELVALRVNPFWFGHSLYAPARIEDGGPFTIGRVIHTSRTVGITGAIGGVAVFGRALTGAEIRRLAAVAKTPIAAPTGDAEERP